MNARTCCKRSAEAAGWLVPGATLMLLPKCPACVVAYVALFTGAGISFTAAAYLRTAIVIFAVSLLMFTATRRAWLWWRRRSVPACNQTPRAVSNG